jgi:hypothetical protein
MYKFLKSSKAAIRFSLKHSKSIYQKIDIKKFCLYYSSHLEEQIKGLIILQAILFLIYIGIIKNNELKLINQGTLRFGKIHQIVVGISRKVLSEQLKSIESDELALIKQFEEIPLRMEYALTDRSKGLWEVFEALEKWSTIVAK